jgi:protein-L-isoaspartate(D-aspartate) O-methyltransferase
MEGRGFPRFSKNWRSVSQMTSLADSGKADDLRDAMADRLVADGWITSPEVEAAFRSVPRHEFVPQNTTLEDAYGAKVAPVTKTGEDGEHLSSVSAPWLQARMIAQAGVQPGMSVLEIGSGGYNAALLSEVTGKEGRVVTIDIDPEITGRAEAALAATGYGERVVVVTGDGELGVPGHSPYDAIIVTVGAWDVPRYWTEQLADSGRLVVPLRLNTLTRSLGFRLADGRLAGESWEMCGFVPMQGIGGRPEPSLNLPGPAGGHVSLRFDQGMPADSGGLDGALMTEQVTAWSGIRIGHQVSFADLNLWLAAFLPGFCRVAASEGTALHAQGVNRAWFPFGGVLGDSLSCLAMRKLDGTGPIEYEFGARAYGPHAADAAQSLNTQVRAWDAHGRDLDDTAFTFWPAGTAIPPPPPATAIFPKVHGTVTVSWPGTS